MAGQVPSLKLKNGEVQAMAGYKSKSWLVETVETSK